VYKSVHSFKKNQIHPGHAEASESVLYLILSKLFCLNWLAIIVTKALLIFVALTICALGFGSNLYFLTVP